MNLRIAIVNNQYFLKICIGLSGAMAIVIIICKQNNSLQLLNNILDLYTTIFKKENGKISANQSLVITSCSTNLLFHIGLWHYKNKSSSSFWLTTNIIKSINIYNNLIDKVSWGFIKPESSWLILFYPVLCYGGYGNYFISSK